MTLLSIIEDVTDELGLPQPSAVIAATDQTTRGLLRMATRAGRELRDASHPLGGWTILNMEHTFTTVASQAEYTLPSDFRRLINETAWDRDSFWRMRGGLSPQEWQAVKSGLAISPALRLRWRIKRGASTSTKVFNVDPTPTATGENLVFEYTSTDWVRNTADTATQDGWVADTDVALLEEGLITMGVIWRFLRARGLAFATQLAEYEREVEQAIARDGGAPTLHTARRPFGLPIGNVPETGFGS